MHLEKGCARSIQECVFAELRFISVTHQVTSAEDEQRATWNHETEKRNAALFSFFFFHHLLPCSLFLLLSPLFRSFELRVMIYSTVYDADDYSGDRERQNPAAAASWYWCFVCEEETLIIKERSSLPKCVHCGQNFVEEVG